MTPTYSSRVQVTFTGNFTANSTVFSQISLRYGTGAAPSNGAALTGTVVGSSPGAVLSLAAGSFPYAKTVVITGLTPGTAYWFDLSLVTNNGISTAITANDCAGFEFGRKKLFAFLTLIASIADANAPLSNIQMKIISR